MYRTIHKVPFACLIVTSVAVAACGKKTENTSTDAGPASASSPSTTTTHTDWEQTAGAKLELSVLARDLGADYAHDRADADARYKGKVVEVLGVADEMGSSGASKFFTVYDFDVELAKHHQTGIEGVRCNVNSDDATQMKAIDGPRLKYSSVRVRGRVSGRIEADHVVLDGCVVDLATLGKDTATKPTIAFPRNGAAEDCAKLDACCPASATNRKVGAMCTVVDKSVHDRRANMTCAGAIDLVLGTYKDEKIKAPDGCVSVHPSP